MTVLAAPGDTWGISGPNFLYGYGVAFVVLLLIGILRRRAVLRGATETRGRELSAAEIALVVDGPAQAVFASLAALRTVHGVDVGPQQLLTVTGPIPPDMSPLDKAVYEAAGRGVRANQLIHDIHVRSVLDQLEASVRQTGWVIDREQRSQARLASKLMFALLAVGVIRLIAGISGGKAVGFLIVALVITFLTALVFLSVPRLSAAGQAALARQRSTYRYLSPDQSPAWGTYGYGHAAMGVALFGTAAFWAADPGFAEGAGLARHSAAVNASGSTYGGGSDGGGSDGGGSDGGGGGGCGGGGCGGGGCGG